MKLGRFRWVIVGLLFCAVVINYMDRQVIGLLKPVIARDLGWGDADYGTLVSVFQVCNGIGQFVWGAVLDAIGTRTGFAISIALWSLAAMANALPRTLAGFGLSIGALGFGESGNFPAAIKAVAEWFPRRERALATGIFNAGSNVGTILGPVLVPLLVRGLGWRETLAVIGSTGFAWLLLWLWIYRAPEKSPRVGTEELAHIRSDPSEGAGGRVSYGAVFRHRETWAYVATSMLVTPAWWFYLFWLPPFFDHQFGLSLQKMSLPLVLIYGATIVGSVGGGWLSSHLIRRGRSVNFSRKTASLLCALLTVPVVAATSTTHLWVAAGLFALAASAHQGWAANLYTVVSDLFPQRAVGRVVGLGGLLGATASGTFAWVLGRFLQRTGSYTPALVFCGCAYVTAWLILMVGVPVIRPVQMERPQGPA